MDTSNFRRLLSIKRFIIAKIILLLIPTAVSSQVRLNIKPRCLIPGLYKDTVSNVTILQDRMKQDKHDWWVGRNLEGDCTGIY